MTTIELFIKIEEVYLTVRSVLQCQSEFLSLHVQRSQSEGIYGGVVGYAICGDIHSCFSAAPHDKHLILIIRQAFGVHKSGASLLVAPLTVYFIGTLSRVDSTAFPVFSICCRSRFITLTCFSTLHLIFSESDIRKGVFANSWDFG